VFIGAEYFYEQDQFDLAIDWYKESIKTFPNPASMHSLSKIYNSKNIEIDESIDLSLKSFEMKYYDSLFNLQTISIKHKNNKKLNLTFKYFRLKQ
jgi:hypothetical protein